MKNIIASITIGAFFFNAVFIDLGWADKGSLLRRTSPIETRASVAEVKAALTIPVGRGALPYAPTNIPFSRTSAADPSLPALNTEYVSQRLDRLFYLLLDLNKQAIIGAMSADGNVQVQSKILLDIYAVLHELWFSKEEVKLLVPSLDLGNEGIVVTQKLVTKGLIPHLNREGVSRYLNKLIALQDRWEAVIADEESLRQAKRDHGASVCTEIANAQKKLLKSLWFTDKEIEGMLEEWPPKKDKNIRGIVNDVLIRKGLISQPVHASPAEEMPACRSSATSQFPALEPAIDWEWLEDVRPFARHEV